MQIDILSVDCDRLPVSKKQEGALVATLHFEMDRLSSIFIEGLINQALCNIPVVKQLVDKTPAFQWHVCICTLMSSCNLINTATFRCFYWSNTLLYVSCQMCQIAPVITYLGSTKFLLLLLLNFCKICFASS